MSLVCFVLLPALLVFAGLCLLEVVLAARQDRATRTALLLADLHAAHETIPLHEERRQRELAELNTLWARS
jgi:hypothetical protein